MPYDDVTWDERDPVIASKLQQMADNDYYMQQLIDNKMPRGILGGAKRVTGFDFSDLAPAGNNIPGLYTTITVPPARIIKVSWFLRTVSSTEGNTAFNARLMNEDTLIGERGVQIVPGATGAGGGTTVAILTPAAGTYTFNANISIVLYNAPPVMSLQASAEQPSIIWVEDIGSTTGISISET